MKKSILFLIIFFPLLGFNQVGIGTEEPKTTLDVDGDISDNTKADGFQVPTFTVTELEAKNNAYGADQDGVIVFITTGTPSTVKTEDINGKGFYYYDATESKWVGIGSSAPDANIISLVNCGSPNVSSSFIEGTDATGETFSVDYTGGNGGAYDEQIVNSTNVTGLTATLAAGLLNSGDGTLTFSLSGTPAGDGIANFDITVGGQNCTVELQVDPVGTPPGGGGTTPLPNNIELPQLRPYFVASINDNDYLDNNGDLPAPTFPAQLPGNGSDDQPDSPITNETLIDIQGTIPQSGITIKVAYDATAAVTLPAFGQTITVDASNTEDGISRDLTFSYPSQSLTTGSGYFDATLKAVGGDLLVKKLDINSGIGDDFMGLLLGTFTYEDGTPSSPSDFEVRAIAGLPDKYYQSTRNPGHDFLYMPLPETTNNNTWLTHNLGAEYCDVTSASFDPFTEPSTQNDDKAVGSLLQFGRDADGHEFRDSQLYDSSTNGQADTTVPLAGNNWDGKFIIGSNVWADSSLANIDFSTLWNDVNAPNNPCPSGYGVPTETEIDNNDFNAPLFLVLNGNRSFNDGSIAGNQGWYISNTLDSGDFYTVYTFNSTGFDFLQATNARGTGVRCIKRN